jgi:hypothetical protein
MGVVIPPEPVVAKRQCDDDEFEGDNKNSDAVGNPAGRIWISS